MSPAVTSTPKTGKIINKTGPKRDDSTRAEPNRKGPMRGRPTTPRRVRDSPALFARFSRRADRANKQKIGRVNII
jgi:hypothetical protein